MDHPLARRYQSLQEIVYSELRDNILNGKLKPGEPLNTNRLSREMDISRTPIREAINRLCEIGLVVRRDHMEAKVASFHTSEIYEFYYARNALEGLASRNAAIFLPAEEKKKLLFLVDEMEKCAEKNDLESYFLVNHEFHSLTYGAVRTPMIAALLEQIYAITVRYRAFAYVLAESGNWMIDIHRSIAKSIAEGDKEAAGKWSAMHNAPHLQLLEKMMYSKNPDSTDWRSFWE